jgi:hypothetical protein
MEELQEFQTLLMELLQALQLSMSSGEALPDEIQGMIAQTLEALYNRIEQLSQGGEAPIQPPNQPGPMEGGMPSSNVEGFSYDKDNGRLYVRFLGKHPNRDGPIYSYDQVPPRVFDLFRRGAVPARTDGKNKWGQWWKGKVPSMGASVYTLLKQGGFPYQRVH